MRYAILLILAINILFPNIVFSAPSVSGVSGTIADGESVNIAGSSFGTKSPAAPVIWAPFEGSLNPSNLGTVTSWAENQNAGYTTAVKHAGSGSMGSTSGWTSALFNAAVSTGVSGYNKPFYVNVWRRATYSDTQASMNLKFFRVWPVGLGYPNWYISKSTDSEGGSVWSRRYTESCTGTAVSFDFHVAGTTFRNDEYIWKTSSSASASDGILQVLIDGVSKVDSSAVTYDCAGSLTPGGLISIQDDPSNYTPSGDSWYDDIYVDTTWARVVIGNASTLATSTHREIQIPSAWSASSIDVTVNRGSFGATDTAYLFVVDADGSASAGQEITFGDTEADTTPPSVGNASPSGELNSGTTSTAISVDATDASGVTGCKYDTSDVAYASMSGTLTNTSGNTWDDTVSVSDGNSYTYYARCIDTEDNANMSSTTISFSVASDTVMCYPDVDEDTYGDINDAGTERSSCQAGEVEDNTDCNDSNASIHPGATDTCGDGIDQNCSGGDAVCSGGKVTRGNGKVKVGSGYLKR
jgi:hypothetical protein